MLGRRSEIGNEKFKVDGVSRRNSMQGYGDALDATRLVRSETPGRELLTLHATRDPDVGHKCAIRQSQVDIFLHVGVDCQPQPSALFHLPCSPAFRLVPSVAPRRSPIARITSCTVMAG